MLRRSLAATTSASVSASAAAAAFVLAATRSSSASAAAAAGGNGPVFVNPADKDVRAKLLKAKTLVVLGLSEDERKPSYSVVEQLVGRAGQDDAATKLDVIPVRPVPEGKTMQILGFRVRGSLQDADVAAAVKREDCIVDVFRKSADIPKVLAELQALGARNVWLQHGVRSDAACIDARDKHGMWIVQDKCILLEHQRLVGEQW